MTKNIEVEGAGLENRRIRNNVELDSLWYNFDGTVDVDYLLLIVIWNPLSTHSHLSLLKCTEQNQAQPIVHQK